MAKDPVRDAYRKIEEAIIECLPDPNRWHTFFSQGTEHELPNTILTITNMDAPNNDASKDRTGIAFAEKFVADAQTATIPLKYEIRFGHSFSASDHVASPTKQQDVVLDAAEAFVRREGPSHGISATAIDDIFSKARTALREQRARTPGTPG